jgi:uncharacterized membrane protein
MWLAMIAFWALLIWAIYALFTGITRRPGQTEQSGQRQPCDTFRILDDRPARGEIDTGEYQRLRDVLGGGGRSTAGSGGVR